MKVVVQADGLLVGGVGSACAMALTLIARNLYLAAFYSSLTVGMGITTIVFWALFRKYDSLHMGVEITAGLSEAVLGLMH
jgi:POT family proton-dependent oligopeptide transporter